MFSLRNLALALVKSRRAWAFRHRRVPWHQSEALALLLEFANGLESAGVRYFLLNSTLLGAVRQGSFAGEVKDIDLGILVSTEFRATDLDSFVYRRRFTPTCPSLRFDHRRKYQRRYRLTPVGPSLHSGLISVVFYVQTEDGSYSHIIESQTKPIGAVRGTEILPKGSLDGRRFAQLFGFTFPIPTRAEELLSAEYGDWQRVIDRQYSWYPTDKRVVH